MELGKRRRAIMSAPHTETDADGAFTTDLVAPLESLSVAFKPVQDLHGQAAPYPAGGGKNLIDDTGGIWTLNAYVNAEGVVSSNNNYKYTTDLIPVEPSTTYYAQEYKTANTASGITVPLYDEDGTFIQRVIPFVAAQGTGIKGGSFTTTSETRFIRISCEKNAYNIMLELGSTRSDYQPYSNICPISGRNGLKVYHSGKNLCDPETYTTGYFINASGVPTANTNGSYSALIPVTSGATYTFSETNAAASDNKRIHGYDSGGTWVQQLAIIETPTQNAQCSVSFAIPSGVSYIRVSHYKFDEDVQVETGSSATAYEPYRGQSTYDVTFPALGKNLFNQSLFETETSKIVYTTMPIANGTYTMSTNFPRDNNTANVFVLAGIATSGASSSNNGVTATTPRTITVTDGCYTVAYRSSDSNNANNPKDFNFQLEASSSATAYEPFNNLIYGGTLDAITGELTVTWSGVVMDGTVNKASNCRQIGETSEYTYLRGLYVVDLVDLLNTIPYNTGESICSHFQWYTYSARRAARPNTIYFASSARMVYWCSSEFTTLEEFNGYLQQQYAAGTPVTLVYPRGTSPIDYRIDPQRILTLSGDNVLVSGGEAPSVTFWTH